MIVCLLQRENRGPPHQRDTHSYRDGGAQEREVRPELLGSNRYSRYNYLDTVDITIWRSHLTPLLQQNYDVILTRPNYDLGQWRIKVEVMVIMSCHVMSCHVMSSRVIMTMSRLTSWTWTATPGCCSWWRTGRPSRTSKYATVAGEERREETIHNSLTNLLLFQA